MIGRRAAVATLIIGICTQALAFTGEEHRYIARTGMQLAVAYCAANRAQCSLTPDQEVQLAAFSNLHSRLDYGVLVSSVDYRLNPLQLLQKAGPHERLPSAAADIDPHLLELVTGGGSTFLRAATVNETHFQGDLIAGIRNWHAYAVSVAAGTQSVQSGAAAGQQTDVPGNLFAALLVNSIADHFLQDFFAPGHIITPRFGLHDAVALSIHNKYNILGADFEIEGKKFGEDLEPLLQYLNKTDAVASEHYMQGANDVGKGKRVPLWGDTLLYRSPAQELLMILVETRSILDIIESASGHPVNRFLDVRWEPMTYASDKQYTFASAGLPYGKYVHHDWGGRQPTAGTVLAFSAGAELLLGAEDRAHHEDKATTARTVFAVESLVRGHLPTHTSRHATDPTKPLPVHFSEKRQWGLNVGYVFAYNATETAHGPVARAIWALPLLHTQFSADVSEKSYSYKDQNGRRTAFGARIQSGFSLLLFDLGLAREWTYSTRGTLKPEMAIRFGGTLTGPLSSIPVLRHIEEHWYKRKRPDRAP